MASQNIPWAKASNWKIYSTNDKKAALYSIDTLTNFKSKKLSDDSMRSYLIDVARIEGQYGVVWQGYIVGSCELDHVTRKIIFSIYGGFFFDPTTGQYFEIENDLQLRKDWHAYLRNSLKAADPYAVIP